MARNAKGTIIAVWKRGRRPASLRRDGAGWPVEKSKQQRWSWTRGRNRGTHSHFSMGQNARGWQSLSYRCCPLHGAKPPVPASSQSMPRPGPRSRAALCSAENP